MDQLAANSAATESPPPLPRNVWILSWASLLNDIASEMLFPLLPVFILRELGGSHFQLGMIEGAADTTTSLLKLATGGLSDRTGGRRVWVIVGYLIAALIRPFVGLATASWQVLVVRVTERVGKGVRTAPRDAMIAESCEPNQRGRAFGFHRGMDHLGAAIGPVVAMLFLFFWPGQLRTLFLFALVPGLAVTLLLMMGLRETVHSTSTEKPLLQSKPFPRTFRTFLIALFLFSLGNSTDLFLLDRMRVLGVPEAMIPAAWLGMHLLKSVSSIAVGPSIDRRGPKRMLLVGWLSYALVYLGFGIATRAWQLCGLLGLYTVYYACSESSEKTMVANLAGPGQKGLAFGWHSLAIGIGAFPASVLFGYLTDNYGTFAAFAVGAGFSTAAAAVLWAIPEHGVAVTEPAA